MAILILARDDIEQLLTMEVCIELMERALVDLARGDLHQPLRMVVRPPEAAGLMVAMPTHRARPEPAYGLKMICVSPGNPARGLDSHQGFVSLFDGETGELRAVMDASPITAIRTAAVSGVATRALAREDASRLAIIGSGVQARTHVEAMAAVRRLERVTVWSPTRVHAEAFAAEVAERYPFPVEAAAGGEDAVGGADIVVTATSAREPVLRREWLESGCHVNAVGASLPDHRELDSATIAAAALYVDRRESAENEAGDYLIPLREGALGPDHIRGELGEVLTGARPGRSSRDELTVFKSLGLAVEDLAAAEYLFTRARETGAGATAPF